RHPAWRGGSPQRRRFRRPVPRGRGPRHLRRRAVHAPARALRAMIPLGSRRELAWGAGILFGLAALAFLPLAVRRDDVLNFVFLILLSITLAESWNMLAGYVGQVNLGHAAFFGLGALVARTLWTTGTPILLAMLAGAAAAAVFALPIGAAAF